MFQSEYKFGLALLAFLGTGIVAGCSGGAPGFSESAAAPQPGQHQPVATDPGVPDHEEGVTNGPSGHGVHWDYEGPTGPTRWGSLSVDFAMCGTGVRQSPIDLGGEPRSTDDGLDLSYQSTNLAIVNNGHTVQVDHFGDSFVEIDRWPYRLRQFHFHAPSEHTVGGRHAAMEMHLVHVGEWGRLAVVGVMIEVGNHHPAFDEIWARFPDEPGHTELFEAVFVDPTSLLPNSREFYHYRGSLTTPPCTEDVSWYVLEEPITMSAEQVARIREIIGGNNRPVQPLNGRRVYSSAR